MQQKTKQIVTADLQYFSSKFHLTFILYTGRLIKILFNLSNLSNLLIQIYKPFREHYTQYNALWNTESPTTSWIFINSYGYSTSEEINTKVSQMTQRFVTGIFWIKKSTKPNFFIPDLTTMSVLTPTRKVSSAAMSMKTKLMWMLLRLQWRLGRHRRMKKVTRRKRTPMPAPT